MELLYIISNYEKGRCDTNKTWKKKYAKSLKESIKIMKYILDIMYNKQYVTKKDFLPIFDFCKENNGVIFGNNNFNEKIFIDETVIFSLDFNLRNRESYEIINLMHNIIDECIFLLESKERKHKIRISYLLKAFHNLPRAFIKSTNQTFFNLNILSLSHNEALTCAKFYINQMQNISI